MKNLFPLFNAFGFFACLMAPVSLFAQKFPAVVIWSEPGLPAADSPAPTSAQLSQIFPEARLVSTDQLASQLNDPQTRLLILPQGSVVPESAWSAILDCLHRGANLLVLGGRPFTRAAYRDSAGWHLRDYSVRFTRPLGIDQYQVTPGSERLEFQTNPDLVSPLSRFAWKRAFSPVIRLSAVDLYARGGSAGSIDARLDALAWGAKDGRKLAAPVIQVDHLKNGFDGGRWIFLNAEVTPSSTPVRKRRT